MFAMDSWGSRNGADTRQVMETMMTRENKPPNFRDRHKRRHGVTSTSGRGGSIIIDDNSYYDIDGTVRLM